MSIPVSRSTLGDLGTDRFSDTCGLRLPWGRCPGLRPLLGQTGVSGRMWVPHHWLFHLSALILTSKSEEKIDFRPSEKQNSTRGTFDYVDKSSGCRGETKNYHKSEWRHPWFSWWYFHQRLIALCSDEGKNHDVKSVFLGSLFLPGV